MNFTTIDFETANTSRSSVCSMGIVKVENGAIVDKQHWLIKPSKLYFAPINISIHGIRAADVKDKPEFNGMWGTIRTYLEGNDVVAHNASFDFSVLRHVLDEYSIQYPTLNYHCSLKVAKKVWPNLTSHKLNVVANHLGFQFQHHDALEDALAAAKVILEAGKLHQANSIEQLNSKLSIASGKLLPGAYVPARASR